MPVRTYETLQQSASRTGLTLQALRSHIRAGELPAYRSGQRILRVVPADVDLLLRHIGIT